MEKIFLAIQNKVWKKKLLISKFKLILWQESVKEGRGANKQFNEILLNKI